MRSTVAMLTLVLAGAAQGVATAAPAVGARAIPAKAPALHASLGYGGREKLTLAGSIETFSTRGTTAPKGDRIASWSAVWGDGSKSHGKGLPKVITHRYAKAARLHIVFTVTDIRGKHASVREADAPWGGYAKPRAFLQLPESPTPERDLATTVYVQGVAWDNAATRGVVDFGDGTAPVPFANSPGAVKVSHTYASAGSFSVTATARDAHGGTGTQTKVLTVNDRPHYVFTTSGQAEAGKAFPVVVSPVSSGNDYLGAVPAVSAPGATIGATSFAGSGLRYQITWPAAGTYTVTASGATTASHVYTSDTLSVTVLPAPAVTLTGGVGSTLSGDGVPFVDHESLNGHTVVSWDLDPGDGTGDFAASGPFPANDEFDYATPGLYTATLRLTLDDGRVVVSNGAVADVADPPTLTVASTATVAAAQVLTLPISAVAGSRGALTATFVDWGDGTAVQEIDGMPPTSLTHTYVASGTYTANVEVDDDHAGFDEHDVSVTVTP